MNVAAMLNGQFVDINQPVICIEDRAYQFGDGVYEVVPIVEGRMVGFEYHMDRLDRSLREMRIPAVYTREELFEFFVAIMQKAEIYDGNVYLQISRGASPRVHQFPLRMEPVLTMVGKQVGYEKLNQQHTDGVKLISTPDIRWHRCDIKSVNLLGNVFARQKALDAGFDDAVFYREDTGHITECTSSTFYVVKDGVIWTHPNCDLILPGCTRRIIINDLCGKLGLTVIEKAFNLDFAKKADEAFMSASVFWGLPAIKIDKTVIGGGQPGPVTRMIYKAFKEYALAQKVQFEKK